MLFSTRIKKEQQYKMYTAAVWSQKSNDKTLKRLDTPGCNSTFYKGLLCRLERTFCPCVPIPFFYHPFFLPFILLQCLSVLINLSSFTCCCLCPPFLPHIIGLFHCPSRQVSFTSSIYSVLFLLTYLSFNATWGPLKEPRRAKSTRRKLSLLSHPQKPTEQRKSSCIENLLCSGSPKAWVC